jgi:hypothetical protein
MKRRGAKFIDMLQNVWYTDLENHISPHTAHLFLEGTAMKPRISLPALVFFLAMFLVPGNGFSEIVGYITLQHPTEQSSNAILPVLLFADPDNRWGDPMVLEYPDIPYYIAHFPDYSHLVTANWRKSSGHEDTWAKVEPQSVTPPLWDVYYLNEDDRSQ